MNINKNEVNLKIETECSQCGGTGLYQGMAEKDGAAVECYICNGSGKKDIEIKYKLFNGRKIKENVNRVYKTAGGYCITDKDTENVKFSQYGISYQEWLDNKKPIPIYDLHCPLQHYGQGTIIGEWLKDKVCPNSLMMISKCNNRLHKTECWEKAIKYERETR